MYFNGEYREIGWADPAALQAELATLAEETWGSNSDRQQVYRVHATTQTIPLLFDADMRHTEPTVHPLYDRFLPLLTPAMGRIAEFYRDLNLPQAPDVTEALPYFVRINLVRLAANTMIQAHRDNGHSLSRAHRVHYPIVTSEQTIFGIEGNNRHLAAGELWEVNNRKVHAVRNDGQARIHAIFDYVIPGEIVNDPLGQLVA